MPYHQIGYTKDHLRVVYDPEHSHAATHIADTPGLLALVQEVIANIATTGEYMWFETDMGRQVGMSSVVDTSETDDIVYAKRLNRDTYTRFTKSRGPEASSIVTVALRPINQTSYELTSAWIGSCGYPFPDDPNAAPESCEYWASRALVWGTQAVQPGTETERCPWN